MKLPNTILVRKVIETPMLVAILEVPALVVDEMPGEPLLEAKTVRMLAEARKRAAKGGRVWLKKKGARLYSSLNAS